MEQEYLELDFQAPALVGYGYGSGSDSDSNSEQQEIEAGSGSGIIIGQNDTELLIVTNYHVIEDADSLTITFNDEATAKASVKGTDSDNDLAVVAVSLSDLKEETKNAIAIATMDTADDCKVGQGVTFVLFVGIIVGQLYYSLQPDAPAIDPGVLHFLNEEKKPGPT